MSTFYLEMHYVQGHYNPILKVHCMKNEPDRANGREYVKTIIFVTLNLLCYGQDKDFTHKYDMTLTLDINNCSRSL